MARTPSAGTTFRILAGALTVFDGILLYAVVRAAAGGFETIELTAAAVSGVLMIGLSAYLLVRAPEERAARALAGVLLVGFPALVFVASEHLPTVFYHAGMSGLFVRLVDATGGAGETFLTFMLTEGDFYIALLTPLALLYLAQVFPRPLTALDISQAPPDDGRWRRLWHPASAALARLRRALLHRRWRLLVGLLPPASHTLEKLGLLYENMCSVFAVLIVLIALSYLRDGYAVSDRAGRRRVLWVLGGLFLAALSISVWAVARGILYAWSPPFLIEAARWLALLAAPAALALIAAGVLYRGAFDPALMVRRTTVYGILGLVLTMVFAAVEEVTTERVMGGVGLPDTLGAAIAAALVLAIYRPLRDRLTGLYDGFLGRGPRPMGDVVPTLLLARIPPAERDSGVQGLLAGELLHRCARRTAADQGGEVVAADEHDVALAFDGPAAALDACRALRGRLAAAVELLGARRIRPGWAVYRPADAPGPDGWPEALDRVRELAGRAAPGEVVVPAALAAEPGVIRAGRLEPVDHTGAADLYRLAEEDGAGMAPASWRPAVPVVIGVVAALALPLILLADPPAPDWRQAPGVIDEAGESAYTEGVTLSREQVRALAAGLDGDAGDAAARALLVRHACAADPMTIRRWRGHPHALWLLEHRPEHPMAVWAAACLPDAGPVRAAARRVATAGDDRWRPFATLLGEAHRTSLTRRYTHTAEDLRHIAAHIATASPGLAARLHNRAETALGLAALETGDTAAAAAHLTASMTPPGAPEGAEGTGAREGGAAAGIAPYAEMALAAALWDAGARDPVVGYLEWAAEGAGRPERVEAYLRRAREGRDPGFTEADRRL